MTSATEIIAARNAYRLAIAAYTAFVECLDADFPMDFDDSDDDAFEAWNDAYETAYLERGGYRLSDAKRDTATMMIVACKNALWERTHVDARIAWIAAIECTNLNARTRLTNLCLDLDVTTI